MRGTEVYFVGRGSTCFFLRLLLALRRSLYLPRQKPILREKMDDFLTSGVS